jgi:hypothetical protein
VFRKMTVVAPFLLATALAVPGFATLVAASGAGPLPASAQDLTGIGVTEIVGTLSDPLAVDMFAINILYPTGFSAYTVGSNPFSIPDPELFLFDASGLGVLMNDDVTFSDTQACLPSLASTNPCPNLRDVALGPLAAGTYYLAITRSENMPLSNSGYIFSPVLSTDVVGPDPTQGGGNPIVGWDGGVFTSPNYDLNAFDIVIQDTPEPALGWITACACAAFLLVGRAIRPAAAFPAARSAARRAG